MDIRISNLGFEYPNRTFRLDIPELFIESGSSTAFVGPSGSGKTTLLRLIAGINLPECGELILDSTTIPELHDGARRAFRISRIGFVFQDYQLIDYLNVEENIRLPYRIHPAMKWGEENARRLDRLIEATGIAGKRRRAVDKLSQGEKQRVAICRALIAGPRLVLADEPTGNLDPAGKRRILELLFEETRKHAATLIMVTHDRELLDGFERIIDFANFQAEAVDPPI